MRNFARESKKSATWTELMYQQFPPRLANSPDPPRTLGNRMTSDFFILTSKFEDTDVNIPFLSNLLRKYKHNDIVNFQTTFTFSVSYNITPLLLLKTILAKRATAMNTRGEQPSEFILRICGREDYIYGEYPFIQFLYIQETLARDGVPTVVTMPIKNVPREYSNSIRIFKVIVFHLQTFLFQLIANTFTFHLRTSTES